MTVLRSLLMKLNNEMLISTKACDKRCEVLALLLLFTCGRRMWKCGSGPEETPSAGRNTGKRGKPIQHNNPIWEKTVENGISVNFVGKIIVSAFMAFWDVNTLS